MPIIKKFIPQSDGHKCALAVIRMIRETCELALFTDNDVLKDFPTGVELKGPDLDEIGKYWLKYSSIYCYEKGDNQCLPQIKIKLDNGYWVIIIIKGAPFHCVLFDDIVENKVHYWDPQLKHQEKSKEIFDAMRIHDDPLFKKIEN